MSLLKDLVSGGLPAVLDTPEGSRTAYEPDNRNAPRPSDVSYNERVQPVAPGATTTRQGGLSVAGMSQQQTLMVFGGLAVGVIALALIVRK